MEKEKSILVTGAAGMQGRQLVKDLADQPQVKYVKGIDDFSRPYLDDPMEWARAMEQSEPKFSFEKMRYQNLKLDDLADFDAIIHLAGYVSVPESIVSKEQQLRYRENNAIGVHDLLLKLKYDLPEDQWPIFVQASTAETYGEALELPIKPSHPQTPRSPYAVTKHFAEDMVNCYSIDYRYPGVAVRSFNTFGPNQNCCFEDCKGTPEAAVVALFIKKALLGKDLHIHGTGAQTRDFQYVSDMVTAYRLLALDEKVAEDGKYLLQGRKYNLGTGHQTSIDQLADKIIYLTGSNSKKVYTPERPGEIPELAADFADIVEDTGYESTIKLEDGLKLTIDWYRQRLPELKEHEQEVLASR